MTDAGRHTLYICYFGLREPLVQTQVIPYLQEIAKADIKVSLLTFEPEIRKNWTAEQIGSAKKELAAKNIDWDLLAYHKRPSAIATAYDILHGVRFVRRKMRDENIDILHGRVHVATLMGAIARKLSGREPKLIFDIRGFFPEEYTDAGVWPENGLLFRAAKRVERWLMRGSDGFVILTEKAKEMILAGETRPVEVIPCCVDFESRFASDLAAQRDTMREKLGVVGRTVYAHVGALGGLYLTGQLADFIASAREADPSAFALFLTQSNPEDITKLLKERGFAEIDYFAARVQANEVPVYLSAADAGLSFVKATYATQSRSPTKIPEYLAAGLPIIANSGVGDVDKLINDNGVGVLIDRFDREAYLDAIERIKQLGDISERCRSTALREFDLLTVGGPRYRRLYEKLLQS